MNSAARALERLLEEALTRLVRSYGSIALVERRSLGVALLDRDARVVTGVGNVPVGNLEAIGAACASFVPELATGDAVVTNDPYSGGIRVNDHVVLVPVGGRGGVPYGLAVALAPFVDVGGARLGNDVPEAADLFAEGVRTTPVRLRRGGRIDADVVRLLALNSRVPALVEADLGALLSTATALADASAELLAGALPGRLLATARDAVGRALADVPARELAAPVEAVGEVRLRVAPGPVGGPLGLDFAGSSPQAPSHHNASRASTVSAVVRAVARHVGRPADSGVREALAVAAPEGTIVACAPPAAVGGGLRTTCAVVERLVGEALAGARPGEAGSGT